MEKPDPFSNMKPKGDKPSQWQMMPRMILQTPFIRKLYGLDKKPTTLSEMKPKEK